MEKEIQEVPQENNYMYKWISIRNIDSEEPSQWRVVAGITRWDCQEYYLLMEKIV